METQIEHLIDESKRDVMAAIDQTVRKALRAELIGWVQNFRDQLSHQMSMCAVLIPVEADVQDAISRVLEDELGKWPRIDDAEQPATKFNDAASCDDQLTDTADFELEVIRCRDQRIANSQAYKEQILDEVRGIKATAIATTNDAALRAVTIIEQFFLSTDWPNEDND